MSGVECAKCGLPISGTMGSVTRHDEASGVTTHDPGPYHFPECMPAVEWAPVPRERAQVDA